MVPPGDVRLGRGGDTVKSTAVLHVVTPLLRLPIHQRYVWPALKAIGTRHDVPLTAAFRSTWLCPVVRSSTQMSWLVTLASALHASVVAVSLRITRRPLAGVVTTVTWPTAGLATPSLTAMTN